MRLRDVQLLAITGALVVICLALTLLTWRSAHWSGTPPFLTQRNIQLILYQSSLTLVLAAGMTFVIISGGIDLSVGSVLGLCTVIIALVLKRGGSVGLGALAAMAVGVVCGALSGGLIVGGRIPPFIATLGMMLIARGAAYVASGQQTIGVGTELARLGPAKQAIPLVVPLAAIAASFFVLSRTRFGRHLYAIGGNEEAARLSGLPVERDKLITYCLSGLCAGLGAVVYVAKLDAGSHLAGEYLELYAIAAVIIGGTSLMGGEGHVLGSLVGALIMGVLHNGLQLLQVQEYWRRIVIGAIIVAAVFVDQVRRRRT